MKSRTIKVILAYLNLFGSLVILDSLLARHDRKVMALEERLNSLTKKDA